VPLTIGGLNLIGDTSISIWNLKNFLCHRMYRVTVLLYGLRYGNTVAQ
jgi:hypothetical protein